MKKKFNLRVGQTVLVKKTGDSARYYINNNLEIPVDEYKVVKVGRKYFYLDGYLSDYAFNKETFYERTEYSKCYKVYESKQAIKDEEEYWVLSRLICDKFRYGRPVNITLNQLRGISNILNEVTK